MQEAPWRARFVANLGWTVMIVASGGLWWGAMKSFWVGLTLCMVGCAPASAPSTPEAVVSAIYGPLVKSNGKIKTDFMDLPMTEDLQSAIWAAGFISNDQYCALECKRDPICISRSRCESGAQPSELEKDVAGVCIDCSGFSKLSISQTPDNSLNLPTKVISATFSLSDGRTQSVYFHLLEGEDGWQVDNIVGPDNFNLRQIASDKTQGLPTYAWPPVSPN
jgi:hypothetical protein